MKLWRLKWSLVRLTLAASLAWVLASAEQGRVARRALWELPAFDFAAETRRLADEGRFAEALLAAETGMERADGFERDALERLHADTIARRDSWWRRARDVGSGAITGRGSSLEELLGAIGADMLVVGDVRDLVIEGGRLVADGETDEVVLLLSAAGLATTAAPVADWGPAVLKVARKTGAMTRGLAEWVISAVRGGRVADVGELYADVGKLADRATPAVAVRALAHAETPGEVKRLAAFAGEPGGPWALYAGGADAARVAKSADPAARAAFSQAAAKGPVGVAFWRTPAARAAFRPHVVIGLAKGIWKGNVPRAVERLAEWLDASGWWLLPLAAAWLAVEASAIVWRLLGVGLRPAPNRRSAVVGAA